MRADTKVDIPLIDFAPFSTNDTEHDTGQQRQVAQQIYHACHTVGFLYLRNHGISDGAIAQAFTQAHSFFDLPMSKKLQVAWSSENSNRGYVGMERERLDESQPGDLKEAFNVGREFPSDIEDPTLMANRWPASHPIFQQRITQFFEECTVGAHNVLRAFAIALSLPPDALTKHHQNHGYTLRLLHYPPLQTSPKSGQIRAGAHSDYGSLTLLFQDSVGGLEVLNARGEWIAAPAVPGAVLINTGDLLQRWSNDVFLSTRHRVALPQRDKTEHHRYSIAFFCQPDANAQVACLPTCQDKNNPPKYPPITSGEYLLDRLRATY